MKKSFKLIAIVLAVAALATIGFTACDKTETDFTVGILQPVAHDALGAANRGFQEELTRLMNAAGKTVAFDDQNAHPLIWSSRGMATVWAITSALAPV